MSNVLSMQAKPVANSRQRVGKGFKKELPTTDAAVVYFNGKLAKWQGRVEEVEGARLEILIPHTAFKAMFPNGFVIYYEIEP